jgi:ATP-dependent DNA helicase PIF1
LLKKVLAPTVRFTNGVVRTLEEQTWEVKMDARKRAWRIQFPLALAWALTIHKAQGMTLSKVQMKLSTVWETGHAYVALSRATSEDGLYLIDYDVHKVRASPTVLAYYREVLLHQPSL